MRAIAIFSPSRRSGKSWLTIALGRSLARSGWRVAPFQSQTEITQESYRINGLAEISQSAAWQAWAAQIQPTTGLNPVLLKAHHPADQSQASFQLLIQGRGIGTVSRTDYYQNYYEITRPLIRECLGQLQQDYDILLCDTYRHGLYYPIDADSDQNFELLKNLQPSTVGILLLDCKNEGELNQLWGLWQRLSPENRQLIRGIVLNQWQGDRPAADQVTQWITAQIQRPVLGYLPPLRDLAFSPSSALTFQKTDENLPQNKLRVQVLTLPHFQDYLEFDPLRSEPSLQLEFIDPTEPLGYPDAVIIPPTNQAIADLEQLQKYSYPQQLQDYLQAGGTILGIGNGATLCSQNLRLPNGKRQRALGLMPFEGQIQEATNAFLPQEEIISLFPWPTLLLKGRPLPWELLNYNLKSGYRQLFKTNNLGIINQNQSIWAVYLQGLFNNGPWRRFWLNTLRHKRGLTSLPTGIADFHECREMILETLANHIEQYLDLDFLLTEVKK